MTNMYKFISGNFFDQNPSYTYSTGTGKSFNTLPQRPFRLFSLQKSNFLIFLPFFASQFWIRIRDTGTDTNLEHCFLESCHLIFDLTFLTFVFHFMLDGDSNPDTQRTRIAVPVLLWQQTLLAFLDPRTQLW